jgi:hypothetical protein
VVGDHGASRGADDDDALLTLHEKENVLARVLGFGVCTQKQKQKLNAIPSCRIHCARRP